jgi:hypothetical protein
MSSSLLSTDFAGLLASLRRELIMLVAALAFGVLAVPPLLWLAGPRALGPYPGGGIGSMITNFFGGLASGSFGFWTVAVAPYILLIVVRVLFAIVRSFFKTD